MAGGHVSHFYEAMREVVPGDLIFPYANVAVQDFGFAKTHCYSFPRPNEFGKVGDSWNDLGWRVEVDFQRFSTPLRTMAHASEIEVIHVGQFNSDQKHFLDYHRKEILLKSAL